MTDREGEGEDAEEDAVDPADWLASQFDPTGELPKQPPVPPAPVPPANAALTMSTLELLALNVPYSASSASTSPGAVHHEKISSLPAAAAMRGSARFAPTASAPAAPSDACKNRRRRRGSASPGIRSRWVTKHLRVGD